MRNNEAMVPADSAAILQLGIAHPDARIDRGDGRTARGRLQRQADEGRGTSHRGPAFAISSWSPSLAAP